MSPTDAGSISPDGHTVRNLAYRLVAVASLLAIAMSAQAWEHEASKVRFTEYREGLVEELREKGRPYFQIGRAHV